MAEVFIYLFIGHLVGDWIVQTSWMANEKSKNLAALLAHALSYSVFIFIALYLAGVSLVTNLWATLFLGVVTHAFLDNRRFEVWWIRKIKKFTEKEMPIWLLLGVDQSFHLLLILIVSLWVS